MSTPWAWELAEGAFDDFLEPEDAQHEAAQGSEARGRVGRIGGGVDGQFQQVAPVAGAAVGDERQPAGGDEDVFTRGALQAGPGDARGEVEAEGGGVAFVGVDVEHRVVLGAVGRPDQPIGPITFGELKVGVALGSDGRFEVGALGAGYARNPFEGLDAVVQFEQVVGGAGEFLARDLFRVVKQVAQAVEGGLVGAQRVLDDVGDDLAAADEFGADGRVFEAHEEKVGAERGGGPDNQDDPGDLLAQERHGERRGRPPSRITTARTLLSRSGKGHAFLPEIGNYLIALPREATRWPLRPQAR